MATATLQNTPTPVSTAETTTGWTGTSVALDNEIFVQGSNSVSSIIQAQANKSFLYYTLTSTDLTNHHVCMWWQNTAYGKLTSTNAVQVYVGDGTNISYFNVRQPVGGTEGLPEYAGGWTLLVVDLARTPDQTSGTAANLTAVTRLGVRVNYTASPRNVVNNWLDHIYTIAPNTPVYDVYGGTSGDEISWEEIAVADAAGGWGLLQSDNGVYRLTGPIQIGDNTSTNATYFKSDGQVLIPADGPVGSDYYSISFEGNTTGVTDIDWVNGVCASANNRYDVDGTAANINDLDFDAVAFSGGGAFDFKAGQSITGSSFTDCGLISPSTATFTGNTISNTFSTAITSGALEIDSTSHNVSACNFVKGAAASHAIVYTATGSFTLSDCDFSGYNAANGNNDSTLRNQTTGTVTVNASGNTGNLTYQNNAGATTVINNNVTVTFSNMKDNTEVRIYNQSTGASLDGIEDAIGGSAGARTFAASVAAGTVVKYIIHNKLYEYIQVNNFTWPSTAQTIVVQQRLDLNYFDPV